MSEERLQEIKDSISLQYKVQEANDLNKFNIFTDEEQELVDEIERLKNELEVSRNNEETYRLEMLDITKRLGLDEGTLFDDVKDKAERLNNIINELEKWVKEDKECFETQFYMGRCVNFQCILDKIQELKGSD